jgi:PKD repeat protein
MATVKFSNSIKGTLVDHISYNFGDGTTFSTTDQTVYHNYLIQGDYTYTLQAFSDSSIFQAFSYPISVHW